MNPISNILKIILILILMACGLATTRPKTEMSLAQAAFVAARNAKAPEKAKALYRKAEIYYLKAKSAYRRKYFNKAKDYALLSIKFSEEAEYKAKLNTEE